jgi:hypothetical protein
MGVERARAILGEGQRADVHKNALHLIAESDRPGILRRVAVATAPLNVVE